jgi:hypothetical protein
MRENRPYGSEGGESGSTGLPYPYRKAVLATCRGSHLSPDGGGFIQRRPPLGSGWLRKAALATCPGLSQTQDCEFLHVRLDSPERHIAVHPIPRKHLPC